MNPIIHDDRTDMPLIAPTTRTARVSAFLRPSEWGPAKNHDGDPRSPEALAGLLDRVLAHAGKPDDN